jgi:IS605 OrfB family transposase
VSRGLRQIAAPFVAARPAGARVRTRLHVSPEDEAVLAAVGAHLGRLAGADLAVRCGQGRLDARERAVSRQARKQAMAAVCSARWAGAVTRTTGDAWALAERNLHAEARSLRARIGRIRARLSIPAGERRGRVRGYATPAERWQKQRRLQVLTSRLAEAEARLAAGRVSICRGGRRLARVRHQLDQAGQRPQQWRTRWEAARLFLTADGEADKNLGNETIRWHPALGWVEIKLPAPLAHLANRPHGRYRIDQVKFGYRGDEVAAQVYSGAVRYDIWHEPSRDRWYLDASWKTPAQPVPSLDELRQHPVMAVDLNAGHLAAWAVGPCGNPAGRPKTIPLELAGLPASTRDGRLRAAISHLIGAAKAAGCKAIVIEDLNFSAARGEGREHTGHRPSRGRRGRTFRQLISNIPTAKFRDRLAQMAANTGLSVVAVDPAYTSRWGAEHWLAPLRQRSPEASSHHAAALVIGRRALGQRARRRERCDLTRPEDRRKRATNSAMQPTPAPAGLPPPRNRETGNPQAHGQPQSRHKTQQAHGPPPADQATQDRSETPAGQDSLPPSIKER